MITGFSIASPYFLSVRNFLNIGQRVSIYGIVAVGLSIVMIAGGIDLSIGSVIAATTVLVATLIKGGTPIWIAALAGCAGGAVWGVMNGLIITKARIAPIVCTLGTMSVIRGVAYLFSGGQSVSIGGQAFAFLARGQIAGIPNLPIWWLITCGLGLFILRYTLLGHYVYAIGGNAEACRVSSVHVDRWRFITYVLSGLVSGFAGVLLLSVTGSGAPFEYLGAELDIITAVILGGIGLSGGLGGIAGTMLGTLILGVLANGMVLASVPQYWNDAARGIVMVAAVTLDSLRRGGGYR